MDRELRFAQGLARARSQEKSNNVDRQAAKVAVAAVTPGGQIKAAIAGGKIAMNLAKQIRLTDVLYVLAAIIALFKDLLDFSFIGSLPLIGTIITICFSLAIFLVLLFADSGASAKRRVAKKMITRGLVLAGATAVEGLAFGFNFFPIETAAVGLIFILALRDRAKESSESYDESPEYASATA